MHMLLNNSFTKNVCCVSLLLYLEMLFCFNAGFKNEYSSWNESMLSSLESLAFTRLIPSFVEIQMNISEFHYMVNMGTWKNNKDADRCQITTQKEM